MIYASEENRKIYNPCNNPNGHGHNYTLEVTLTGPIDSINGMIIHLSDVKHILNASIVKRFDHKNLNLDCTDFSSLVPTAENIIYVIADTLVKTPLKPYQSGLVLHETRNNKVILRIDKDNH